MQKNTRTNSSRVLAVIAKHYEELRGIIPRHHTDYVCGDYEDIFGDTILLLSRDEQVHKDSTNDEIIALFKYRFNMLVYRASKETAQRAINNQQYYANHQQAKEETD